MERNNNPEQTNPLINTNTSQTMEEEDADEISFNRRRPSGRRSSRLLIEEEEKEENKREDFEEESQGNMRRSERRNRPRPVDVLVQSQRRSRDFIEENSNRRLRHVSHEEQNRGGAMQVEEENKENNRGVRGAMLRNLRERHFPDGGRVTREGIGLQQATRTALRNRAVEEENFEEKVCSRCG